MSLKQFDTKEDVELLIEWMQSPPDRKPDIPFDAQVYLERLQMADRLLRQHMSMRKVRAMLFEHYKRTGKYSESTARRDVDDAQKLLGALSTHTMGYWTDLMLDCLQESLLSAKMAHKYSEVARLSKEIREYMLLAERLAIQQEVPPEPGRIFQFAPEEAGVERDPDARQKALAWIAHQKRLRLNMHNVPEAKIVDNEQPNDGS